MSEHSLNRKLQGRLTWRHCLLFLPLPLLGSAIALGMGMYEYHLYKGSYEGGWTGVNWPVYICRPLAALCLVFMQLCLYCRCVHWTQFRFLCLQLWPKIRGEKFSRRLALLSFGTVAAVSSPLIGLPTMRTAQGSNSDFSGAIFICIIIALYGLLTLNCFFRSCGACGDGYVPPTSPWDTVWIGEQSAQEVIANLYSSSTMPDDPTFSLYAAAELRGPCAVKVFDAMLAIAVSRNSEELREREERRRTLGHRLALIYLYIAQNGREEECIFGMLSSLLRRYPASAQQRDQRGSTMLHLCSGVHANSLFQNAWTRMNLKIDKIDFDVRASRLAQVILDISPEAIRITNNAGFAPLEYAEARTGFVVIPLTREVLLTRDTRQMMQSTGRTKSGGQPARLSCGHAKNVAMPNSWPITPPFIHRLSPPIPLPFMQNLTLHLNQCWTA